MKIRNDQNPRHSSCMAIVIEFYNFKTLTSLLHGYHIPQLQSITNLSPCNFFGLVIPPLIFLLLFLSDVRRYYMSITSIMIVSNIIVLVSQNIIFLCLWVLVPMRKLLQVPSTSSLSPSRFSSCFTRKAWSTFWRWAECEQVIAFSKILHFRRKYDFFF